MIHETSSPEISVAEFLADINKSSRPGNELDSWAKAAVPTHVPINRVRDYVTNINLSRNVGGIKYEGGRDVRAGRSGSARFESVPDNSSTSSRFNRAGNQVQWCS